MSQTLTYVMGADRRVHVKNIQDFKIDFSDDNHNWVQARQFERGMRQVFVNIVNEDGTPFDLTGCNVWFEGLLPKTADGDFRVIDDDGYVPLDPSAGKFRFDMPGHAFTVAGSYRQAFFRILKNNNSVTTLEFDLDVLADKVIDGLVPKTWIGPFDKIADQLVESLQKHTDDADKILADFQKKVGDLIAQLNQQGSTTTSMLTELQNRITDLETKINQNNLVTQPQLDAFKQTIQQQFDELLKLSFEEGSEDNVTAQQSKSLYSYASEGLAKREALAPNVLRVGTLNLALAGALNVGIDVGNFWSETDKAARRQTENQMAMDWMGCNIVGCQEVLSSMLSGAYNSFNRAMADDSMYPNLYVGLSPAVNHQLQTWNGMREGNAIFADRQMSYVALTAYSSDPNRSYLAYRTTFNNKNVLVVVTHNNVNDESEFEQLATFCAQQTFDACIILADTNNDPDGSCVAKLLAAGFNIVSKKDDNTMITEPAYSGHQMQIFYKGCVLQKKELYDVTTFEGSDHKAIVAEFKVGD